MVLITYLKYKCICIVLCMLRHKIAPLQNHRESIIICVYGNNGVGNLIYVRPIEIQKPLLKFTK